MKIAFSLVISAAFAAAVAFSGAASADMSAQDRALADSAVLNFGAPEFQTRQAAVEQLVRLGPDVAPIVRKLYGETTDAEVKLRCEMVMKGIADRWGVMFDLKKSDAPIPTNLGPSKITLALRDVPLRDVLDDLARLSGNALLVPGNSVKDKLVTLEVKDATYWEAVGQLCRANSLLLTLDAATSKPAIVEPDGALDPGACAGPVAFRINSGSVSRPFRVAKTPWSRGPGIANVSYTAGIWWEDRLNISTVVLQFKQVFVAGKDILPGTPQTVAQTVTPGARTRGYAPAFLNIAGVSEGARKFDEILGVVRVSTRLGEKSVKLDDLFAAPPGLTAAAGGVSLALKGPVDRRKTNVVIPVTLKHELGDEQISFAPEAGHATFALVDPKGAKYQATVEGGRFGAKKTGRKTKQGLDETTEEADFTLRFFNVAEADGKWALVLTWPEKVDTREYPFQLKNVPVP